MLSSFIYQYFCILLTLARSLQMIAGCAVPHVKPNALSEFSIKKSFSSTRSVYCGNAITSM